MKKITTLRKKESRIAYLFIAAPILLFTIFTAIPFVLSFILSFYDYDFLNSPKFSGLSNFNRVMSDPLFWSSLLNTIKYTIFYVPLAVIAALVSALALNKSNPATVWFRVAFYVPVLSSTVATATIWLWIYNAEYGLLNQFLSVFGIEGQPWLNQSSTAMGAIILMTVWASIGINMMLFLAALQNVPKSLQEAAMIDGASTFKRFLHVTLPSLKSSLFFINSVTLIAAFQMFDQAYMLTKGSYETSTVMYYIYTMSFGNLDMGYGAMMAVILFIVTFVISLLNYIFNGRE